MRISDWSSDVCSSDLAIEITADHPIDVAARPVRAQFLAERIGAVEEVRRHIVDAVDAQPRVLLKEGPPVLRAGERGDGDVVQLQFEFRIAAIGPIGHRVVEYRIGDPRLVTRSEERRVGQEGVSTWRSRWA